MHFATDYRKVRWLWAIFAYSRIKIWFVRKFGKTLINENRFCLGNRHPSDSFRAQKYLKCVNGMKISIFTHFEHDLSSDWVNGRQLPKRNLFSWENYFFCNFLPYFSIKECSKITISYDFINFRSSITTMLSYRWFTSFNHSFWSCYISGPALHKNLNRISTHGLMNSLSMHNMCTSKHLIEF